VKQRGLRFATSVSAAEKKRRILVVDDHPKVLRFIEIDLKLHGFDVITASSGEQALELVKAKKPDIMLLDIIMPGMHGLEVLRQLRTFHQLPVIAFSASIFNQDEAIRLGANAFIAKPFKSDDLMRMIDSLLPI